MLLGRARTIAVAALLATVAYQPVSAQQAAQSNQIPTLVAGNAVLGGVTAAVRAVASKKPIGRAFITGAMGGLVHGTGKALSPRYGFAAVTLGNVGTSMVANAGRGAKAFDELSLPIGPARLRVSPSAARPLSFSVNGYETVMLASRLTQPDTRVDWALSRRAGTVVLRTSRELPSNTIWRAEGATAGSTITISDLARDPAATYVHERVHAQQEWFVQETWNRPIEMALRERTPGLRWVPSWFEFGVIPPALLRLESGTLGASGPLRSSREWEAEALESRPR